MKIGITLPPPTKVKAWQCVCDSRVVGHCAGNAATGEVLSLSVLPNYERLGIGQRLLSLVVDWLRAEGVTRIWLDAPSDPTRRAYGFYRALGWLPSGEQLIPDHEILELHISDGGSRTTVNVHRGLDRRNPKPETRRRRRFTARDRKRLTSLYRRSTQSAVEFCREHDVCPSSLWRWLAGERHSGQEAASAGELVEIPMAALRAAEATSAAVSMQIAGVARLEVAVGTDPQWLGALVRALTPARQ